MSNVDKKVKIGLVVGGSALIIGYMMLRGSGGDSGGHRADPNVLSANVAMNDAAMKFRTAQAEAGADIVINRDKVTGATSISAMQAFSNLIASGNDLTARLNESYAGIVQSRISSSTAISLEASRASVAKKLAKLQAKSAKHGADLNFFGSLGANVLKSVPSIVQAFS